MSGLMQKGFFCVHLHMYSPDGFLWLIFSRCASVADLFCVHLESRSSEGPQILDPFFGSYLLRHTQKDVEAC